MGIRNRLQDVARGFASATGEALLDYGGSSDALYKADKEPDEGQDRTPGGKKEDSANSAPVPTEKATEDPKSLFWDPFAIIEQLGFKEKPSQITYGTLRHMVYKTPIIRAIIQTRLRQIGSFCRVAQDRYSVGFRVKLRDAKKEPTKKDTDWIQQAQTMLLRTGITDNPRGRTPFASFVHQVMQDSLFYDQCAFEIVPNRKGQPVEWYAIDASTIRLADSASARLNEDQPKAPKYVQIYDSMIINEYSQEELAFGIRNPSSDIRLFGYGTSEVEMLIVTITAILFGWEYNQNLFKQGAIQKGLINFKGAIPEKQMNSFRRMWYSQLASVANAWRTPIVNAEALEYVKMQDSNRDMEFSAWFDFLIKISCSMLQTDPSEINFQYGNTGQKSALASAGNKEKIMESKERGLTPLLQFQADMINRHILWPLNEDFEFEFCGLNALTRKEQAELDTVRVKSTRMVDELRAADDLPPLPDGKGEVILDPTWLQFMQIKEGGGEQPGGFGDEDGDGEPDFESLLNQQDEGDEGDEEQDQNQEKKNPFGKKDDNAKKQNPFGKKDDNAEKSLTLIDVVI